jgi:hypothetical protein
MLTRFADSLPSGKRKEIFCIIHRFWCWFIEYTNLFLTGKINQECTQFWVPGVYYVCLFISFNFNHIEKFPIKDRPIDTGPDLVRIVILGYWFSVQWAVFNNKGTSEHNVGLKHKSHWTSIDQIKFTIQVCVDPRTIFNRNLLSKFIDETCRRIRSPLYLNFCVCCNNA